MAVFERNGLRYRLYSAAGEHVYRFRPLESFVVDGIRYSFATGITAVRSMIDIMLDQETQTDVFMRIASNVPYRDGDICETCWVTHRTVHGVATPHFDG